MVKHYLPSALECISQTGQTVEQHNCKVEQMHLLALNFASQLEAENKTNQGNELFGTAFRSLMEKQKNKEYITVEEFIPGKINKHINNTGKTCVDPTSAVAQKGRLCLTCYMYERSKRKLMLVEIQGSGFDLSDPEIASTDLIDKADKQFLYCTKKSFASGNFNICGIKIAPVMSSVAYLAYQR